MTFLNPLILFGLIAAGIPLLIHLFNFRRPQKVDFSSIVFLRELQSTTMQRVKIKQWLLLLLRTLAIASLVLSFARPTLKGSIASVLGGDAESASVLVLDNSLSMRSESGCGTLAEVEAGGGSRDRRNRALCNSDEYQRSGHRCGPLAGAIFLCESGSICPVRFPDGHAR
jgi:hypothetical protein